MAAGDDIFLGGADDIYNNTDTTDGIIILGQGGDDIIAGNAGDQILNGGSGDDLLLGGAGTDILNGGNQNDTLFGGRDGDFLFGGSGEDTLSGDAGADFLNGGFGADTFLFNLAGHVLGTGVDTVDDFSIGEDVAEIKNGDVAGLSVADSGADLVLSYNGTDVAIFSGLAGSDLGDLGFVLVP